jgi:hypothetical protein
LPTLEKGLAIELVLRREHKKMTHPIRAAAMILCCIAALFLQSQAQNSSIKRPAPDKRITSKDQKSALLEQSVSLVNSLVMETESYRDQALRARVQAGAADTLWDADEVLARGLFLRAWKEAEKIDKESEQTTEQAHNKALSSGGGGFAMIAPPTSLRLEVLRLAAQRDPALGENFLKQFSEDKKQGDGPSSPKDEAAVFDPTEPKLAVAKRLEVALQLLEAGDVKQAKVFAEPGLDYVTSQGIIFVSALRHKDPQGADDLYARLLARSGADPTAEATTVSLLSSYVFTPNLLVTATRRGRVSNRFSDAPASNDFSPVLRTSFLNVAARILLRPLRAPEQDRTSAGRAGTYFTIARLLPLFQQYAENYVPALNTQLVLLSPDAPETFRNGEDKMLKLGLAADESNNDVELDLLDQLTDVAISSERDKLYVNAIRLGASKGDSRIREFAGKIEDADLRARARSFADLAVIHRTINKKDVDGTLDIVRNGYLTPLHRVWALAMVSRIIRKSDSSLASQLINEAITEANRISMGEPDRVYASACVALPLLELDRDRLWDVGSEVVKAANAAPGFTGEGGKLTSSLRTRNIVAMLNWDEPSFNIISLFDFLSRDDLQVAISLANNLKAEAPRAVAILAIARSVLKRYHPSQVTSPELGMNLR